MTTADIPAVAEADLLPIAQLCDGEVSRRTDGGRNFIYMEGLHFYVSGGQQKMDALLCLNHNNPAYPTKLYLTTQVGNGLNWNESAYILGRHWYTFSWRDVSSNQPVIEILAAHLAPLNQR
jgi:hypothetical protein